MRSSALRRELRSAKVTNPRSMLRSTKLSTQLFQVLVETTAEKQCDFAFGLGVVVQADVESDDLEPQTLVGPNARNVHVARLEPGTTGSTGSPRFQRHVEQAPGNSAPSVRRADVEVPNSQASIPTLDLGRNQADGQCAIPGEPCGIPPTRVVEVVQWKRLGDPVDPS